MGIQGKQSSNSAAKVRSSTRYWRVIKGNLYARLQYRDASGAAKEKLRPISEKRAARSVVEEMRRELEARGPETFQSDKVTFGEFAEGYKSTKLGPAVFHNKVKISGRKSNVEWAYRALIEFFGKLQLRSIKPTDIEAFRLHRLNDVTRRGTNRNIATVNRELSLLRAMLNHAVRNDLVIQNPFTKLKGIIATSAEIERDRVLSFEEEARLLAACAGRLSHIRAILICALDTGMRSGEIFKMRWGEVDFERGKIHIPQTNTKTEESRMVGITPRLRQELLILSEFAPTDEQKVFGIETSIKSGWRTLCRIANVADFRFHDCRHTATTRMIASGSPHTEVMKITGHSQLKTFLRYLNITPEAANTVALRLDQYITKRARSDSNTVVLDSVS